MVTEMESVYCAVRTLNLKTFKINLGHKFLFQGPRFGSGVIALPMPHTHTFMLWVKTVNFPKSNAFVGNPAALDRKVRSLSLEKI